MHIIQKESGADDMKSKIFPSNKCKEYKKYQSNYEENTLNDLKEHKYPLPMYKVENIAEIARK